VKKRTDYAPGYVGGLRMEIDVSAATTVLDYLDDEVPLQAVWRHPATQITRTHAALLDWEYTKADIEDARQGEDTTFGNFADIASNRERILELIETIQANEPAWTETISTELQRVTPDADLSDLTIYLSIGYEFGIGLAEGAVINLNTPLFFDGPRQLLYTLIHESSHVLYADHHGLTEQVGPDALTTPAGRRHAFQVLFQTEAFATYTPLNQRRADGKLGTHDHPVCTDYAVITDGEALTDLVGEYDDFRSALHRGTEMAPNEVLVKTFQSRLPYRVGGALLDRLEHQEGIEAVKAAFSTPPSEFLSTYDWLLEPYRQGG